MKFFFFIKFQKTICLDKFWISNVRTKSYVQKIFQKLFKKLANSFKFLLEFFFFQKLVKLDIFR